MILSRAWLGSFYARKVDSFPENKVRSCDCERVHSIGRFPKRGTEGLERMPKAHLHRWLKVLGQAQAHLPWQPGVTWLVNKSSDMWLLAVTWRKAPESCSSLTAHFKDRLGVRRARTKHKHHKQALSTSGSSANIENNGDGSQPRSARRNPPFRHLRQSSANAHAPLTPGRKVQISAGSRKVAQPQVGRTPIVSMERVAWKSKRAPFKKTNNPRKLAEPSRSWLMVDGASRPGGKLRHKVVDNKRKGETAAHSEP